MGSAQIYYWLLQSVVGLREINHGAWQAAAYLFKRYTAGMGEVALHFLKTRPSLLGHSVKLTCLPPEHDSKVKVE